MYLDPLLSTFVKHLWQWLQPRVFLGRTLQAWHTCIWGVSPILLCRSSQSLSGWMGSIAAQLVQVSSEMFDWVQVRALAGPLKNIQRLVLKPLLGCLGCVLRVVVLLEGESSPQSEVLNALVQVFHQGSLCILLRSSFPRSWLVSQFLPLQNCVLGDRQCYKNPQICASTRSCLWALRTILSTSRLGFCSDMHCQLWDLI